MFHLPDIGKLEKAIEENTQAQRKLYEQIVTMNKLIADLNKNLTGAKTTKSKGAENKINDIRVPFDGVA